MFENMTYENILENLLKNVPSDIDKREGSIIFDALSPVALEIAQMYINADIVLNEVFADTANREYLILRAKEIGITPKEATNAILKLVATYNGNNENISIGDRFSLNGLNYVVTEQITDVEGNAVLGNWKVMCETAGTEGNRYFGTALPISTITDIATAEITELLIPGEDLEDTEIFRKRYFDTVNNDDFGGNRADYKKWLNEFDGVGMVKLVRTPESGGTVGVIITDSENAVPSDELLNNVKEWLDPKEQEGLGAGIVPIGHIVDVKGVVAKQLSIRVTWQLLESANEDTVYSEGAAIIKAYLSELNEKWEDTTGLTVNAFQLMARLSELNDIVDISELTIDGKRAVTLNNDEIFDFNYIVFNGGDY